MGANTSARRKATHARACMCTCIMQDALRKVVHGVGGLDHADFRAFRSERKSAQSRGFVDGDLVESFLDLDPVHAQKVGKREGCSSSVSSTSRAEGGLARICTLPFGVP